MPWTHWVKQKNPLIFVGLAGVEVEEGHRPLLIQRMFNFLMALVAILALMQWEYELLNLLTAYHRLLINVVIWLFFVLDLTVMLIVVSNRREYLRSNWAIPCFIFLGIFVIIQQPTALVLLFRGLLPFFAILILLPSIRILIQFFSDGRLRTTLLAAAIIVVVFGLLVAGVDPNVKSPWDGIWWALATVSTVGYGDVVPTSALGRLLGAGLVVLGLGMFAVITANFLALILKREVCNVHKEEQEVEDILRGLKEMMKSQNEVKKMLGDLGERIEKLERRPKPTKRKPN